MRPSRNERLPAILYSRKQNGMDYEMKGCPFYVRLAKNVEKSMYSIQSGLRGNEDSTYVYCSNLPYSVKAGDQIFLLGRKWTVQSVGYFLVGDMVANQGIMSDEALMARCPKGIVLR